MEQLPNQDRQVPVPAELNALTPLPAEVAFEKEGMKSGAALREFEEWIGAKMPKEEGWLVVDKRGGMGETAAAEEHVEKAVAPTLEEAERVIRMLANPNKRSLDEFEIKKVSEVPNMETIFDFPHRLKPRASRTPEDKQDGVEATKPEYEFPGKPKNYGAEEGVSL